jgi:fructokinase
MKSDNDTTLRDVPAIVVGLGELIWDLLPTGKQLGGATTNFAYISHLLGNTSLVVSRVGDDDLGREARDQLARLGIVTDYLQLDYDHPTGTVGVQIDQHGEALFAMNEDSAWDYLEWTDHLEEAAASADTVCFGTLAQRDPHSRATILRFVSRTRQEALRIFDVNLRHAFFTAEMLSRSLELATIVKLNCDELERISGMLGLDAGEEESLARQIIDRFDISLVAITRAGKGSALITKDEDIVHPGFPVEVVDTIGSGDAFAAVLAHYYVRGLPLPLISEAANRAGSWIATQVGATPEVSEEEFREIIGDLSKSLAACEAGDSIEPGVERSETPGTKIK